MCKQLWHLKGNEKGVYVLEILKDNREGRGVGWKDGLTDGGEEKAPHIHPVVRHSC